MLPLFKGCFCPKHNGRFGSSLACLGPKKWVPFPFFFHYFIGNDNRGLSILNEWTDKVSLVDPRR